MKKKEDNIKIGITIGDINGIGPEIIIRALADSRVWNDTIPIIYASGKTISFYRKAMDIDFGYFHTKDLEHIHANKVNVLNVWDEVAEINPGQVTENGGIYALKSLEAATADLIAGKIDAVVTAPISKKNITNAGFSFPGHTEYFSSKYPDHDHLMIMKNDELAIATATGHIPLSEVPSSLSVELIKRKIKLLHDSLKKDFNLQKPRIAVLGLNPHAGEEGILGREEIEIIGPAIEECRNQHMLVYGPYPSDGFFGAMHHLKFDGVLAMYHDQGLIPFKIFGFESGVNVTAGLPVIRTSPDHGTAFDIAGKFEASPSSFRSAYLMAYDIARNRRPVHEKIRESASIS